jgi:hypothetical protein
MNSYDLSRKFVDFSFENPSKIKPNHYALYFFSIEHCNRLGWKKEFGLPTTMTMEAIGIRSYNTYSKTFNDLVDFGFFNLIQKSTNQYSANIIALSNFSKALDKALDKAFIKHGSKQEESTDQSIDSIDKQETKNKEQINKETKAFDDFWNLYDKKINPTKCKAKFLKLPEKDRKLIMEHIPKYKLAQPEKKFRKDPYTFLNNNAWLDEIVADNTKATPPPFKYVY